jgi:hypothetical protein
VEIRVERADLALSATVYALLGDAVAGSTSILALTAAPGRGHRCGHAAAAVPGGDQKGKRKECYRLIRIIIMGSWLRLLFLVAAVCPG